MSLYSSNYCPMCESSALLESERLRRRHGDDVRVTCQDCGCTWIRYDRSRQRAYEALARSITGAADEPFSSYQSRGIAPTASASTPGQGYHPRKALGAGVAGGCFEISARIKYRTQQPGDTHDPNL